MLTGRAKVKIIVIFLLPAIALVYFSFYFTSHKYDALKESAVYTLAAKITNTVTELVHTIQMERGLSAGFVVLSDSGPYRAELLKQYGYTDHAYQKLLRYISLVSEEKKVLQNILFMKNEAKLKKVLSQMRRLTHIRKQVQDHTIGFSDVITYYTQITTDLINLIDNLSTYAHQSFSSSVDIYKIQLIKEKAGLERAYLYKQLLSNKKVIRQHKKLQELIAEQNQFIKELQNGLPASWMILYDQAISVEAEQSVEQYRNDFFMGKLNRSDAEKWFAISTMRINEFEKLSLSIIKRYIDQMERVQIDAKRSLLITLLLWVLSGFSFLFFLYLLIRSITNENKLIEDLRIASYAFEAHEAMMIMNPHGIILRVNKAFSRITGYEASDVIGKTPKMLGSSKNPKAFYKKIWRIFSTEGHWSGEIYNKRKNGEIYINKLSVVAIKDTEDKTTHYIAQFLDISSLKEAQAQALHRANHDFLTKLPNRESIMVKLKEEHARTQRHHFFDAFLFIDLDDFKKVNDTYGHLVGDRLLQEVARRLSKNIRVEDYVARISGDEFCVILVNLDHDKAKAVVSTHIVCQSILSSLGLPFFIDGHMVRLGASIGVKLFPEKEHTMDEIIKDADLAMYEAKKRGKNRFVLFDDTIKKYATAQ